MTRGKLSDKCQKKAIEVLGREISLLELRVMPYIQYVMMNEQRIEPAKINTEERKILSEWRKQGHIEGGSSGLSVTNYFWRAINEILYIAYVECAD